MSSLIPLTKNPGCGHFCSLTRAHGFVIEHGCPTHDRPGSRPFTPLWLQGRYVCVAVMTLRTPAGERRGFGLLLELS